MIITHVADLIVLVSDREEFWLDLVSPRLYYNFINISPFTKIEMEMHNITMIADLLFDNFDETFAYVTEKQAVTLDFYQNQFTFLQTG